MDDVVEIIRQRINKAPIAEHSIPNSDVRLLILEIDRLRGAPEVFGFVCDECHQPCHARTIIRKKDMTLAKVCSECFGKLA